MHDARNVCCTNSTCLQGLGLGVWGLFLHPKPKPKQRLNRGPDHGPCCFMCMPCRRLVTPWVRLCYSRGRRGRGGGVKCPDAWQQQQQQHCLGVPGRQLVVQAGLPPQRSTVYVPAVKAPSLPPSLSPLPLLSLPPTLRSLKPKCSPNPML